MNTHEKQYRIRVAKVTDKGQIYDLLRENIAREKRLVNPSLVHSDFMEEFVDKLIEKGNMLVVENIHEELELIGEIHDYCTGSSKECDHFDLQEFSFFSRMDTTSADREKEIVTWLFGEIQEKHHNVFRVELNSPVSSSDSVAHYKKMGLTVEGNYNGRLGSSTGSFRPLVPLSWTNPSFN